MSFHSKKHLVLKSRAARSTPDLGHSAPLSLFSGGGGLTSPVTGLLLLRRVALSPAALFTLGSGGLRSSPLRHSKHSQETPFIKAAGCGLLRIHSPLSGVLSSSQPPLFSGCNLPSHFCFAIGVLSTISLVTLSPLCKTAHFCTTDQIEPNFSLFADERGRST